MLREFVPIWCLISRSKKALTESVVLLVPNLSPGAANTFGFSLLVGTASATKAADGASAAGISMDIET